MPPQPQPTSSTRLPGPARMRSAKKSFLRSRAASRSGGSPAFHRPEVYIIVGPSHVA